ncbi:MAG: hypothetical protein ACOH2D_06930 [Gelidibacter sp.]|uniref:hypothetical protein n=1 Tax=Gelidibacter sp. TaxID=2018083 RepID=UPI0032636E37
MAKFVAVDAYGLNIIFSGSDITFVNPHCEKKNSIKKTNDTSSFSQQDHIETQMITLDGNCSSKFQFELFAWDAHFSNPISVSDNHFTSRLSFRYLDSVSPPPRLA